jgi:hypothetical protein
MELGKFVQTQTGKYLMSILIGLGLASLFRKVCKDRGCIIFQAPPLETITDKIYSHDNKCFKYLATSTKCNKSKRIIDFS